MRPILVVVVVAACTPTESFSLESGIYDQRALEVLDPDDRAYVMGHAMGVYLYGQTLPEYVTGTGYNYIPGTSSAVARVKYSFSSVVVAETGGTTDSSGGSPDCSGGDCPPGGGGDGSWIDEDCETFLDPAAIEARELATGIDVPALLGELDATRFELGVSDALALEDLDENTDHSEIEHLKDSVQNEGLCDHSPLVLDLAGDGIAASAPEVRFDLKATGVRFLVAWPRGDDAFLAYDRDGDGRIGDGAELFGNHDAANGFESLAALDNGDGVIDARDPVFSALRLWRDVDRDGASDGELVSLASEGIVAIPLAYTVSDARDPFGNALAQRGRFRRADGREHEIVDVWLRMRR